MKEPKSTNKGIAVAIAVAVVLAVAIVALVGWVVWRYDPQAPTDQDAPVYRRETAVVTPAPSKLETEMRAEFMSGCTEGNPSIGGYCTCAYNHMHAELGTAGLLDVSMEYARTGVTPPSMMNATLACAEVY